MTNLHNSSQPVELELSQGESLALVGFLRDLVEELQADGDVATLDSACEKLEEADALGVWLREGVRAELTSGEASEVTEAIAIRLEEDDLLAEISDQLCDIRQRLCDCLTNSPKSPTAALSGFSA